MLERRLLRMSDVAEVLDVSVARAYELARSGLIPAVRMGRQVRVEQRQLEEWIEAGGNPGWNQNPR